MVGPVGGRFGVGVDHQLERALAEPLEPLAGVAAEIGAAREETVPGRGSDSNDAPSSLDTSSLSPVSDAEDLLAPHHERRPEVVG